MESTDGSGDRHTNALDDEELKRVTAALNHTWEWFKLHAGQRMQLMNFYLLSIAFLVAAFANLVGLEKNALAAGTAMCGIFISLAFNRLDARTRELVQASEPALIELQEMLGRGGPDIGFAQGTAVSKNRLSSYGTVMRAMTGMGCLAFAAATTYSLLTI